MVFSAACILSGNDDVLKEKYAEQMEAAHSLAESMGNIQQPYMELIVPLTGLVAADSHNASTISHTISELYSSAPSLNGIAFATKTGYVTTVLPHSLRDVLVGKK